MNQKQKTGLLAEEAVDNVQVVVPDSHTFVHIPVVVANTDLLLVAASFRTAAVVVHMIAEEELVVVRTELPRTDLKEVAHTALGYMDLTAAATGPVLQHLGLLVAAESLVACMDWTVAVTSRLHLHWGLTAVEEETQTERQYAVACHRRVVAEVAEKAVHCPMNLWHIH